MTEAVRIEWLDAIPTAIFLVQDRQIAYANRSAADLIGCLPRELVGAAPETFFANLEVNPASGWLYPSHGSPIPVAFTVAEVEHHAAPARLITAQQRDRVIVPDAETASLPSELEQQARWLD